MFNSLLIVGCLEIFAVFCVIFMLVHIIFRLKNLAHEVDALIQFVGDTEKHSVENFLACIDAIIDTKKKNTKKKNIKKINTKKD